MQDTEKTNKYKFDLSSLFANDEECRKGFKNLRVIFSKLLEFKGKLRDKKQLLAFLKTQEKYSKLVSKLSVFLLLRKAMDIKDTKALEMEFEFDALLEKQNKELTFSSIEMSKFPDAFLSELVKDPEFSDFDRAFEFLKKEKKHILSEKEEKLLSDALCVNNSSEIFNILDTSEIRFEPVQMRDGKQVLLDSATYYQLVSSSDENVRKQAYLNLHSGFGKFNLTLAANLVSKLKEEKFFAKVRKFSSQMEREMFYEEVDMKIYNNLVECVNENINGFLDYVKVRKNLLQKDKLAIWDFMFSFFELPEYNMDFEEAVECLKKSTSVFGEEYTNVIDKMITEGRIDVFPSENKMKSAFEVSDSNGEQFVFLNFNSNFNSLNVFAHEMGHAMHSYFTEKTQPYSKRGTTIFVAEVASTVNELLLKSFIMKSSDQKTKKFVAESIARDFLTTVFRQTMFSEFEKEIHDKINKDIPVHYEIFNDTFFKLLRKYFGEEIEIPEVAKFEWSRISHFYKSFYVYKYAIGFLSASLIVKKLEEEPNFSKKYIEFLSSGESDKPAELLKIVDVNLEDKATFKKAFELFYEVVHVLKNSEVC